MRIKSIMNLRQALKLAEADLGLSGLSERERELIYGAVAVSDEGGCFSSDELRVSEYGSGLPHSTYHRMLRRLASQGFIEKADGRERNSYRLLIEI